MRLKTMYSLAALAAALLLPVAARAQERPSFLLGAGPADRDRGTLAHVGVLALQTPKRPVGLRADAMAGAMAGNRVGAASLAVEVAPRVDSRGTMRRDAGNPVRGLFLFVAAGPTVVWNGPSRQTSGMLAIGTRVGLGTFTVTAEQRFQEGFSPLLVGLAF